MLTPAGAWQEKAGPAGKDAVAFSASPLYRFTRGATGGSSGCRCVRRRPRPRSEVPARRRRSGGPGAADAEAPRGRGSPGGAGQPRARLRLPPHGACAAAAPPPRRAMAGSLSGMFANQPPGPPPPPGPPGGPGPAGLISPPAGPRNPNNTLVDELEASFEVRGPGWGRPRVGAALAWALPSRRRPPAALPPRRFPLSQACFASLVSQDYVNGTDQEEIRTGEAPAVPIAPRLTPAGRAAAPRRPSGAAAGLQRGSASQAPGMRRGFTLQA